MRRLFATAVLVVAAVSAADPAPMPDPDKAEFSTTDPIQAAMWVNRFHRPVIEVRLKGNELAIRAAEKVFDDELRRVLGKRIDWPAEMSGVKDDQLLVSVGAKYPDPATLPKNDVSEIHYVAVAPIPLRLLSEAERRALAGVRKGTPLRVQGVVVSTDFQKGDRGIGEPARPYFILRLTLANVRAAERK